MLDLVMAQIKKSKKDKTNKLMMELNAMKDMDEAKRLRIKYLWN